MTHGIVVYDPNDENPTGAELSAALAALGYKVRWLLPRGASKISLHAEGVEALPVLAGPPPWTPQRVIRRFLGPLVFLYLLLRGRQGIAIWIRDVWDGFVMCIVSVIAPKKLYFIHNNPSSIRPRSGFVAKLEHFVVRRCHVIVHSEWLQQEVLRDDPQHVHIVAHPNYTLTAASAPRRDPVAARVAYVGGLRPDKGADIITDILLAAGGDFEFRTIGRGKLPESAIRRLEERGVSYVATGGLDQATFLQELAQADVVVAPYLQPTESGSILLCMAIGVPVLAFDSPTTQRILNDASRFSTPADLGAGLARFIRDPWGTYKLTPDQQNKQCLADLEVALSCRTLSR